MKGASNRRVPGAGWIVVAGRFTTMLGTGMAPVCLAAAGLQTRGIGAGGLGFIVAGLVAGELAFTVLGGVFADHAGARTSMVGGDLVAFLAQGSVALLFAVHEASTPVLTGLTFLLGTGAALSNPAENALIKQVCRHDQLAVLNSKIRTAGVLARVLGAPVGGVIASAAQPYAGLFVDAATFLCSAAFLSIVAVERHVPRTSWRPSSSVADIRAGWRSFRGIDWLVPAALAASVVNAARNVGNVLVPAVLALSGYGPKIWGLIFGLQMAGNVVALWTIGKWRFRNGLALSFLGVVLVGTYFLCVAAGLPLPVIGVLAFLAGGSISNFGVRYQLTMQLTVPDEVMSRVNAVASTFSLALAPIATGTLAVVVSLAGKSGALAAWGIAALVAILSAAFSKPIMRSEQATASVISKSPSKVGQH